jgi:hypothetical protein
MTAMVRNVTFQLKRTFSAYTLSMRISVLVPNPPVVRALAVYCTLQSWAHRSYILSEHSKAMSDP